MTAFRDSQVDVIDTAQQALTAARDTYPHGHPEVSRADAELNRIVRESSPEELRAWAARANQAAAQEG